MSKIIHARRILLAAAAFAALSAGTAQADTMWAAIADGQAFQFEEYLDGPSGTSTNGYPLMRGGQVNRNDILDFQFMGDGSMWAAISDVNTVTFERYPTGPSGASTEAHILTRGSPVQRDDFLGFQFMDDGSMWAAISDVNTVTFERYLAGPGEPSTEAFILTRGGPVQRGDFLGFQFMDDGSMWAAISDVNTVTFEHYLAGPGGPSTEAFILTRGSPVQRDDFLGFQFMDDGSMWAAIADGTTISFEQYLSGPGAPATNAYLLALSSNVHRDDLLGFQFTESQIPSPVPEPATWAMMIVGFGLAGAGLRARRRPLAA